MAVSCSRKIRLSLKICIHKVYLDTVQQLKTNDGGDRHKDEDRGEDESKGELKVKAEMKIIMNMNIKVKVKVKVKVKTKRKKTFSEDENEGEVCEAMKGRKCIDDTKDIYKLARTC